MNNSKKNGNALLLIDPQNDFCDSKGSLYVKNAEDDMQRVADFILKNLDQIDRISITMDSHHVVDISHVNGWCGARGEPVNPFTLITHQDILDGKYSWTKDPIWARNYTRELEAQPGQLKHFLWPEHTVIGTWGHNIYPVVLQAVQAWERKNGGVQGAEYVTKGSNPRTEHFGAFQAQVPIAGAPGTQPNMDLLQRLNSSSSSLFVAGEALSHCLACSISQIIDLAPELAKKLVILEDCMSNVPNPPGGPDFTQNFPPIAARGAAMGMRFAKSTDPIGQAVAAVI